ncbi:MULTISPECIES: type II toxin-antitoxin system ParD family antitoxin [Rhizobiaceae]|jgi:antitoxin ParD1/3/4|uniref:Antitoxin ParD1/3/4 n=1 Tax=Aliirhizobium cellulosilyticum TaxID=393664 RepID=A0A7W6WRZ9_9HYPH|nr:type II toxin-antitoxin system ParD family antitoxin [Rhizobium cellulosilyticum]MBB4350957.1 antitoxin ParD1/3/4 [Rhizobium cellulosilyticum]MBB4414056.1 antitoxin ParD1/3/4 [Rhizobium cellulosilyticum]MBB4448671.1 antitoxin ParD1/3/4 [Rhizobium cellulosilyticum]
MGEIISIRVDEETAAYVKKQVDGGRYASESEVIEEALRLLKESEEDEIEALRMAIDEGEASGEPQPFDPDEFIAELHRKHVG